MWDLNGLGVFEGIQVIKKNKIENNRFLLRNVRSLGRHRPRKRHRTLEDVQEMENLLWDPQDPRDSWDSSKETHEMLTDILYYYDHMFRGYYGWHHMFIWSGVQIEILRVTEHDICSSGAVRSLGAKLDIFTHFEAQFGRCSIVVMTDDKMPIGSVQRVIWRVTGPLNISINVWSQPIDFYPDSFGRKLSGIQIIPWYRPVFIWKSDQPFFNCIFCDFLLFFTNFYETREICC